MIRHKSALSQFQDCLCHIFLMNSVGSHSKNTAKSADIGDGTAGIAEINGMEVRQIDAGPYPHSMVDEVAKPLII